MKDVSILSMFSRKAQPTPTPSTTHAPPPLPSTAVQLASVHGTLPGGQPIDMTPVSSRESSVEIVKSPAHTPFKTVKSQALGLSANIPSNSKPKCLVDRLKLLAKCLYDDISRRALPTLKSDPLACFDVDPAGYDDKNLSADELWEDVLNGAMKSGLGWGTTFNVPSLLETSGRGMLGLTDFVEYFIVKRGVSEALFEGKLAHLMDGLLEL